MGTNWSILQLCKENRLISRVICSVKNGIAIIRFSNYRVLPKIKPNALLLVPAFLHMYFMIATVWARIFPSGVTMNGNWPSGGRPAETKSIRSIREPLILTQLKCGWFWCYSTQYLKRHPHYIIVIIDHQSYCHHHHHHHHFIIIYLPQ